MTNTSRIVSRETIKRVQFTVDWITMTVGRQKSREEASDQAHDYLSRLTDQGYQPRLWDSFGYVGWDIGEMRWGRRNQDDLIQLRGSNAGWNWAKWVGFASNISRVDLAATIQFKDHPIGHIKEQFETVQKMAEDLPIARNYSIIQPLIGGDTLYVGKRSSQYFGRLYDKGMESSMPEYANSLRWEVEVKKPAAYPLIVHLVSSEDKPAAIGAFVKGWFEERLIECPWSSEIAYSAIQIPRMLTTDEKALAWLEKQVAPTVQRLIARGKALDVLKSLQIETIQNKGD